MVKVYRLEDLDCANCAAKMEEAISKIDGVNSVNISFLAQKMTIDAEDDKIDDVMKQAVKACKKIEPDCTIILK